MPTKAEIEAELGDRINAAVAEGFDSREDIIDRLTQYAEDETGESEWKPVVSRLTDAALLAHRQEQATWGDETDCDRLDRAFAALEEQGIIARQNFACCNTCGFAEIGGEIQTPRCGRPPIGFAFYHMQDTENAVEGGGIWLKYGSCDPETSDEMVGEKVLEALLAVGLDASWNHDPNTAVQVGLGWRKRREDDFPLIVE
jgi:hypothetical protein